MKIQVHAAALICCATLGAITVAPSGPIFENDQVKVVRALEKAHVKGKFHEHKMNRVMVYLQSGKQRFEYQDGRKPAVFDWKEGQVEWSPADGMHSPEVLTDTPFNIVEVELKSPGAGKTITSKIDPVKIDPKHYKVEFENDQVRVLRVKIEGHAVVPMHEHSLNRVTIYLTDQDFTAKDSTGKTTTAKHKAGEALWGMPITHTETNLSDQPFEVVVVELKS
jgi:quercetin dioxygenase-like cupin family protein